ncbi:Clathrin light chain [Malassezia brasiliensis]|uniref:Clathrin light chain n=1 Tax=Malassezia brasiliensis TaxID=1821822 RepID=A0AAF0IPH6_9BASI|nr:Clathrin light chain [Malassezia brasiliensis]
MAFDFGQLGETDAADPTSDFLQRERQAAGSLLGNDAALFGGSAAQETPEHDFEQAAQDFPALDDDNQFEDALSGAPERPIVPATGLPSGGALTRADSMAETGEPDTRAPVTRVDSLAEFGEADSRTGVSRTDSLAEFSETEVTREPEAMGESGLEARFEASYPEPAELASGVVPVPSVAERAPVAENETGLSDKKTPFTYDALDEDTEALRAWRAKQDEEIARRDAQAERMRAEAASKAEQEIDQFYADYNAEKEKNIRKNKEAEARFREQKQQELAEGTTWSRITKLLDLQNSQSKTIAKIQPGSSNLNRMKELYLSLRREGDTAPGAAGY